MSSAKFIKYLPHLALIALIVFLLEDTLLLNKTQSVSKANKNQKQNEGSKGQTISQEEKERRMGFFHYNEGNKFFKEGRFDEAIINYKKALHHNKSFTEATINLSTAYLKSEEFDKALETLQTGVELDPKNPHIHYNFACYYSLTGNAETSLQKLKDSISLGFDKLEQIETDPDLVNLRQSAGYKNWSLASTTAT